MGVPWRGLLGRMLSDRGLTKKAYLNALAASLDYAARLATGFVINPILVGGLGDFLYGAWQILGRMMGYISAAGGRPTQALKWTIAHAQASTDYEEKRRNVGSALSIWALFAPALAVIGGVLVWITPFWLKAPVELSRSVRFAAAVLVANLIVTNLVNIPEMTLRGENLGYKRMGMSTLLVVVGGGFTALAMVLDTGIVGAAVSTLAATILSGAFYLQVTRIQVPWFGAMMPSFPEVRRFLRLSSWFLLWRFVLQLMTASDVLVLGRLVSVEFVTTYTLTKYIPETLVSMVAIVVGGIAPGLGGILGSGKLRRAARVRSEIALVTWLVATAVGATALLWNRSFVGLWVGPDYYAGRLPTVLIMVMVVQFVLIRIDANIIDLTLNLRSKVLIGAVSALASLVAAGILVGYLELGIVGLCLGFIVGRSILTLGYPWIIGRRLGVSLLSQFRSALRPAFATVLLFAPVAWLGDSWTARTWPALVSFVGATAVLAGAGAFYAGLTASQRTAIALRFRAVTGTGTPDPDDAAA